MRRECIYAFRSLQVFNRLAEWENASKCVRNTIQQAVVIVGGCGTDNSVPCEKGQRFFIQPTTAKPLAYGTHKCVPYEQFYIFQFITLR